MTVVLGGRVGGRLNGQDVMSPYCQRRRGIHLLDFREPDHRSGRWQELVVEDRHASPADVAALKLDFQAWLGSLAPEKRTITESLASEESTQHVAQLFRFSSARISQLRRELRTLWDRFQGEISQPLAPVAI